MKFKKFIFFALFLALGLITAAGCGEKKNKQQQTPATTTQAPRRDVQANNNTSLSANTIVREGEIDLKGIDENKDGKVFQCQMDYNVISDYKGSCPKCGMNLDEVPLDKAKKSLTANGYKVR
ncbi:MAG: hypothetical protein HF314_10560 [Ignavibacteria bacterium]|nr:hypothetical protein [Ignavibacteria bacterium]MCU7503507.1 hypothetical protein [Ignavibacteria bacterium]MCU7517253.1 hypothetical protein [Ignavibacteria bacterium]